MEIGLHFSGNIQTMAAINIDRIVLLSQCCLLAQTHIKIMKFRMIIVMILILKQRYS